MKVSAPTILAFLLMSGTLVLTGCAPMPYQGYRDPCIEVVIIHEPPPPPHYPAPEYPLPRPPAPDRHIPLTNDQTVGKDRPRTKEPARDHPARGPVTRPPANRGTPDPVQVSHKTPRDPGRRTPRTR